MKTLKKRLWGKPAVWAAAPLVADERAVSLVRHPAREGRLIGGLCPENLSLGKH